MSLTARTIKNVGTATGSNTTFAFPDAPIVDDSVEVIVYHRDETTTPATVTLQTEGSLNDYQLTGAPDANSFHTTVEFNSPPAAGKIIIILQLPFTQTLDYNGNNSAGIRPTSLEESLDVAVGLIQQLNEVLTRVPKMGITEQSSEADLVLPEPVSGVEGLFAWSTSGAIRLYTLAEALAGAAATSVADAGYSVATVLASGTLASVTDVWTQYRPLVGSPGAVSASTTPFGTSAGWDNGTQMLLRGTDDTNTVQITHNDAAGGAILNGNAILAKNNMLTLIYDSNDDRWVEVARNF